MRPNSELYELLFYVSWAYWQGVWAFYQLKALIKEIEEREEQ